MGYLSRKTGGEAEAPSSPTNFSFFFTSKFGAASRTWEIVASIIKATPRPQGNWSTCCLNFMLMFLLQHRLQSCIINMFTIFLVKFVIIQPSHLFLVIFRVIISSELQLTCKVKTILLCTLYIYNIIITIIIYYYYQLLLLFITIIITIIMTWEGVERKPALAFWLARGRVKLHLIHMAWLKHEAPQHQQLLSGHKFPIIKWTFLG